MSAALLPLLHIMFGSYAVLVDNINWRARFAVPKHSTQTFDIIVAPVVLKYLLWLLGAHPEIL